MSRDDWFRNDDWNDEIEAKFYAKLKRARRKPQQLRVQAYHLCRSHPRVALKLLGEYFALGDRFDDTSALSVQAQAYLALGDVTKAIQAYEQAVAREEEFPNIRAGSRIELAYLIAAEQVRPKYDRALQLLETSERMLLPVQKFKYHAAYALISDDLGKTESASKHARDALCEAQREHSGLRYHATVGLVSSAHDSIIQRLRGIGGYSLRDALPDAQTPAGR